MKRFSHQFLISIILLLAVDFFFGTYLLKLTPKKINPTKNHNIYDHDLKQNFKAIFEWAPGETYFFCTDKNSFRTFCNDQENNSKEYDIAFIGDSFTEGVGLDYKNTFVGKITKELDDLKIANLGVVSYSPSIYFSKLKYLIDNGYRFKKVVIYFDISDIYDDNNKYRLVDNKIYRKKSVILSKIQKNLKSAFPFLAYSTKAIKNDFFTKIFKKQKVVNTCNYLDYCHEKSSWTFNDKYFKKKHIEKSLNYLEMTYEFLKEKNIKMSLGVYPWPAQIMHDEENSKVVKLMQKFCLNKCEYFFNNFPNFFKELKNNKRETIVSKYYIKNDVHYNSLGNQKLFENFMNTFKY